MQVNKSGNITTKHCLSPGTDETIIAVAQDSVEIEQNAKGQVQFTVKCYRYTAAEALAAATVIFEQLQAKFNQSS